MECWKSWLGSELGSDLTASNWYGTTSGTSHYRIGTKYFPASFIAPPLITANSEVVPTFGAIYTDRAEMQLWNVGDPATYHFSYIAIGRWK